MTVGPIIGLVIFFVFFLVLLYMVFKADKGFINKMKDMPLNDGTVAHHDENEKTE
ncbi:MAG: cytochrome C oxidase Cbb3 [Cyclobacteriaceae bacterium]|nr:cytochrome C oxidase Cbb3 [Cyclobacteriaceae bacterium]